MSQKPTHFIEQVNDKHNDAGYIHTAPHPIHLFKKSEEVTKKFNVNVVAVFKIYPKLK